MSRIPLSILTGFLGSGKTTLLQRLLTDPRLSDAAVVINELGEIGIDHLLVREVAEGVVLLPSGCLCCSTRQDLVTTLRGLFHQRAKRAIPRFGRMIIETTGLADPAPILQTLVKDPFVAEHFRVDGTIVTVDAVHAHAQFDRHVESVRQVAFADRLVITKVDIASAQEVRSLVKRLASINATAPVLRALRGCVDAAELLDAGLYNGATRTADVDRWLRVPAARGDYRQQPIANAHAHAVHDDAIRSFCLVFDQALEWEPFAHCLHSLIEQHGRDVLRVKGILNIASESGPVVIHGVQHVFYPPQSLARWPDGDRRSRLVFITSRIECESVERVFRDHHPLPAKRQRRAKLAPTA
jgi:G3E family GTPase